MKIKLNTILNPPSHPRIAFYLVALHAGGNETHAIRVLEALLKKGFNVTLIVNSKSGPLVEKVEKMNIQLVEIPISPTFKGRVTFIFNLARFLRQMDFDIVQAYSDLMIFYVGLAAKIAGISHLVFVLQNTYFATQYRKVHNKLIGWTCRNLVDCIIVNSRMTAKLMVQEYHIHNERINVIYNGVPLLPDRQPDSPIQRREYLGIPSSKYAVGILARLDPVKRIDLLVKAAVLLSDLPVQFIVIGDDRVGKERLLLERLVEESQLSDRFVFAGYQANPLSWLEALDIGVLSSESEGLPQAILEYMGVGLPVVSTAVGGIPELVVDGITGYLVPPNDHAALALAIRRLLECPENSKKMGYAGQLRARQEFSLAKEIQLHVDVYNTLLGSIS